MLIRRCAALLLCVHLLVAGGCSRQQGPASKLLEQAIKDHAAGHDELAITALTRAVTLCEKGCVEGPEGRVTFILTLADLLERHHRFGEVEALLDQHDDWFSGVARSCALLRRALIREQQGDLRGAERLLQAADAVPMGTGPEAQKVRVEVLSTRATLLAQAGQFRQAYDLMQGFTGMQRIDPCYRALHYSHQGWVAVLARQALRSDHPLWKQLDPVPALEQGLKEAEQGQCDRAHRANLLANLAHAAVQRGDLAVAQRWVRAVRALGLDDAGLLREVADIEGQIALRSESLPADAEQIFAALATQDNTPDYFDSALRGMMGKARLYQRQGKLKEALRQCQAADQYLDLRALLLPLSVGRATALTRFEGGVGLCIDLHLEAADPWGAVKVLRKARNRGLRTLSLVTRLSLLSPERRREWETTLASYQTARRELDREVEAEGEVAAAQLPQHLATRAPRVERLMTLIDQALVTTGEPIDRADPRAPHEGEILLACHPGSPHRAGWRCFLWSRDQVLSRELAVLSANTLNSWLSDKQPAALLGRARSLSVLTYGALRDIDVHVLPGLRDDLDVNYALDAAVGSAALAGEQALVVGNPEGGVPESGEAAKRIVAALRAGGWAPRLHGPRLLGGLSTAGPEAAAPDTAALLSEELTQAALWHYLGHLDATESGALWLRVADEGGLLVSDVLTLPHVPTGALLFGCGTARAESSGAEGLALSHALLLRGTRWVVATGRDISDHAAALMADALYQQPGATQRLRGEAPELSVLLRKARRELLRHHPQLERDLNAFRVLRP